MVPREISPRAARPAPRRAPHVVTATGGERATATRRWTQIGAIADGRWGAITPTASRHRSDRADPAVPLGLAIPEHLDLPSSAADGRQEEPV
ncbi:MAG TPA: hypothetical protein PKC19_20890 [Roseiflexaceae bacterium]|nr:hypothetical protein [Roseiflexaceae bacterium]